MEKIKTVAAGAEVVVAADPGRLEESLAKAEVLVTLGFGLNEEIIAKATSLRWVHAMTAGIDVFLDCNLEAKDILLTTSRGAHATQMTEQAFAFMLSFVRGFPQYYSLQQERKWERIKMDTLDGKTLGIIGLGSIGQVLASRAKAFGMNVIGVKNNPEPLADVDEVLPAEHYRSILPRVDFLVLTVPYTRETINLIGTSELDLMKKDAYLINLSRGPIVDQEALIKALKEKSIAGAGLDVTTPEPLPADSELWGFENVIITPHIGGLIPDYFDRTVEIFCQNMQAYINGEALPNLVDFKRGY